MSHHHLQAVPDCAAIRLGHSAAWTQIRGEPVVNDCCVLSPAKFGRTGRLPGGSTPSRDAVEPPGNLPVRPNFAGESTQQSFTTGSPRIWVQAALWPS